MPSTASGAAFPWMDAKRVYRWAGPYMVSRQVVAVDADSSIQTLGDLAGKTIAVQSTGKPEETLSQRL